MADAVRDIPSQLVDPPFVSFGREICGDLAISETREWLVTNGIGGFASGTVGGHLTRRFHGLLIAALHPPLGRTLLVSKFDEIAGYDGKTYSLATNRWQGGAIDPDGYRQIEAFHLAGTSPVWTYALADARLSKTIWMEDGANTTYVRYKLESASSRLKLQIKALVNYRDFYCLTQAGNWQMDISRVENSLRVLAFEGAVPFYLLSSAGSFNPCQEWYRGYELANERYRGLDHQEDHLHAGTWAADLGPGDAVTIIASVDPRASVDPEAAWHAHAERESSLLARFQSAHPESVIPPWAEQLALAADQFIVDRTLPNSSKTSTVIAGYHWFGDWGRDTMVALPGLALATGRREIARNVLLAWAGYANQGMLPNRFPESGEKPEYNTVDAALWYFQAVREYWARTHDAEFLQFVFPTLEEIVRWYRQGTRYNIHVDPADGLLYAGEPGVQLTWMDAKVGDWVVTPRMGKPVEVNALWLNALTAMKEFAAELKSPAEDLDRSAQQAMQSFERFWNGASGCCFDVLDGPEGNDASLRPNQIFAVALPVCPFELERQRAIVQTVARRLLTSHGLRSLAPSDPQYCGAYGGDQRQRDGAYHQGTVWGWLLGPFVLAHLRAWNDPAAAAGYLEPMIHQLQTHGLGTASEIFDGDAPFTPRGCIAQAWTVAELLRAWEKIATLPQAPAR
ncbi:MAG TPA: amylo-alpha-1,6-glucosidase [Terriglobia bacterium]|nr:amylo-alpha-1,6-glucosidase [Terriglobia bacterium]